jgi:intracellular multiplication protein IcmJ
MEKLSDALFGAGVPQFLPQFRNPISLVMSAKRKDFRYDDPNADEADQSFEKEKRKVKERDLYRCRGCGFKSQQGGLYMQVHHINDDHHDNSMDNLAVLCMHCHSVFHTGFWGNRGEAWVIYAPDIEQWQISHICRLGLVTKVFCQQAEEESEKRSLAPPKPQVKPGQPVIDYAQRARSARKMMDNVDSILASLYERRLLAEEIIGTSDPTAVGETLTKLPLDKFIKRGVLLEPFRLILKGSHRVDGRDVFPEIAAKWLDKTGPFGALDPLTWWGLIEPASN